MTNDNNQTNIVTKNSCLAMENDAYDFLTLSLRPPNYQTADSPSTNPYHSLPSTPSFHPYIRPYPQNPNPNLTTSPSNMFIPDFGTLIKSQNPSPKFLQNPNPSPNPNPNPSNSHKGVIRRRRNQANRGLRAGKSETVEAPFPWATDRRGKVLSLDELEAKGIETVKGDVHCRRCEKRFEVEFEVRSVFSKLRDFIAENKERLRDRSAPEWDNPAMIECRFCHAKEAAKAVVAEKKRKINWLFLLLGGFLCCCTLEQLKYFCKHTGNHRTGAKNRVLYLTYLGLCKQLDPSGPFEALSD